MLSVIEILDSDEDTPLNYTDLPDKDEQKNIAEMKRTALLPVTTLDKTLTKIQNGATAENTQRTSIDDLHKDEQNKNSPNASSIAEASAKITPNTRNRRKALHQPMRSNPEMEFETISIDDDENTALPLKPKAARPKAERNNKAAKTQPKILVPKPTNEELLDNAHNDFLAALDTIKLLRAIAEDRVRVNYLLAAYGMPDINFSMRTHPDRLRFQLDERVRQREMRQNTARPIQLVLQKRLSLLKKDAEGNKKDGAV